MDAFARCIAEMEQADAELRAVKEALRQPDGLMAPHVPDLLAKLSRKRTRQIGDNNMNLGGL